MIEPEQSGTGPPGGMWKRDMNRPTSISASELQSLRELDTCTVSNAIERLDVRMRNEGFIAGGVQCRFPALGSMAGYAVTGRIRAASPPAEHRCYYDRMDWWEYVASMPAPRVMVLQDSDPSPGLGAFVGEIHAAIGVALNCTGCVTNGAVRDLPRVEALGFHLFSGSVSASHAYAHIVEFGEPVEICGLKISPGDLIHGDQHGLLIVPIEVAGRVPQEAREILKQEQELVAFCRSQEFSMAGLAARVEAVRADCDPPWSGR